MSAPLTSPRSAGIALAYTGVATIAATILLGVPGGDYEPTKVLEFTSPDHSVLAFVGGYVALSAVLALVVVGRGLRELAGPWGGLVREFSLVGAAAGVVGAFVSTGLAVAMAEGGPAVRAEVPAAVVHTIGEIGGLLGGCAPAACVGIAAILLARSGSLPRWLAVFSVLAGICGILAPFYFTYFLYLLWTLVCGGWLVAAGARAAQATAPAPAPAQSLI